MTTDEIENSRVEKLKEINTTRDQLNVLYIEKHELEKRLVELSEAIRKGKHVLQIRKTEAEILQSEFWRVRNS